MRYALVFALLAALLAFLGLVTAGPTNGVSFVALYPAVSLLLMAVAYAFGRPALLGKRSDGGRDWFLRILLGPYLLLTRLSFLLYKLPGRHTPASEVIPNLFLGRRLTAAEAVRYPGAVVIDLAAEFSKVLVLRQPDRYLSLPVLDATAPTEEQLNTAVRWIESHIPDRPVFVHCALGHGRSASVVVAYLLQTGRVGSVRDGLRLLRQGRPGVGLSASQRQLLERRHAARNPSGGA